MGELRNFEGVVWGIYGSCGFIKGREYVFGRFCGILEYYGFLFKIFISFLKVR